MRKEFKTMKKNDVKLSVFILEDEVKILEQIKNTIPWEELGLYIIGEADNGRKALEMTKILEPDIVLCDINTPIMNGLEYIENLFKNDRMPSIIILSAYDDFIYAQKAIQYGVQAYILKPIQFMKLKKALTNVISLINDNNKQTNLISRSRDIVIRNIITDIIDDKIKLNDIQDTEDKILYLKQFNSPYGLITIDLNDKYNYEILVNQLYKGISDIYGDKNYFIFQHMEYITIICFFRNICSKKEQLQQIRIISKKIYNNFFADKKCTLGISSIMNGIQFIKKLYEESIKSLFFRIIDDSQNVIFFDDIVQNISANLTLNDYKHLEQAEKKVLNGINKLNREISFEGVQDLLILLYKENIQINQIRKMIYLIVLKIYTILDQKDIAQSQITEDISYICEFIFKDEKLEKIINRFYLLITEVIKILSTNNERKDYSPLINKAISYMEFNSNGDVCLENIASHVNITSYYLSKLFKKETGKNFTYLFNEIRIKKSKELLEKSDFKIFEISALVGYQDIGYFHKMFKRYTNMSPTEYKKRLLLGNAQSKNI